jgi:hypothetical protein
MASVSLEKKTKAVALSYAKVRRYPADVAGAEYSYYKRVDKSGPINPACLVRTLREKLVAIGNLLEKANGNTVGCCVEVNCANQLLIKGPDLKLNKIQFSSPLRPRTMQVVPICKNCKSTFV